MRVTRRTQRAKWLIVLCWVLGCGDDGGSSDSLDERTFLLESSEGFEPVEDTTVRLRFHDGSLSLNAGCNTHSGDYDVRDGILIFQNIASTEIGCEAPLHKQDMQLVAFLMSKPKLRLDDDRLTLTGTEITLVFLDREVADPDRPLAGTLWRVDTFIQGGAASNLPLEREPTLVFGEDGKLEVDTTCNTGGGRYKVDGERIMLSDMSYTDAACGGGSGAADAGMQAVLRDGTVTFQIQAARLTILRGNVGLAAVADE